MIIACRHSPLVNTILLMCQGKEIPRPDNNNPWIEIKPVSPKEINPEYSLEGLILKFQYFGQPDAKS